MSLAKVASATGRAWAATTALALLLCLFGGVPSTIAVAAETPTPADYCSASDHACEVKGASLLQAKKSASRRKASWVGQEEPLSNITIEVETSHQDYAATTTGATVSFKVNDEWTMPMTLCVSADFSEVVMKRIDGLAAWPSQLRITAVGNDAWGYRRISMHWGHLVVQVLRDKLGNNEAYVNGSVHWVDNNEAAPPQNIYDVPEVQWQAGKGSNGRGRHGGSCTTREDSRADVLGYTTSPAGTQCVFGVDPRDEGYHCIMDEGEYGSLGWCYTNADKNSFGSCSPNCPLFGMAEVLGNKIDSVREAQRRIPVYRITTSEAPTTASPTTAAPEGAETEAGAGAGKSTGNTSDPSGGPANNTL